MLCQECGKKLRKNQIVCPWCGTAQDRTTKDTKGKKDENQEPVQVRLSAKGATKRRRLTDKQKKWLIGIGISVGAVILALLIAFGTLVSVWLGQIQRESELDEGDIGINSTLPDADEVQNIALFGLDTRSDNDSGRSDAIIILSIDRVHDKIKLTSIARDSLVAIDGHGQSKITHAFAWGKAKLAVKTINQNYGMNITDYAYIIFYEFVEIIDYVGGVMIDVNQSEANVMNNHYGPELRGLKFNYINVKSGYQRLNGAQALAYSRNRYTGSDIDRGNRQKEVLEAMFTEMKDTPLTKYPSVISRILSMCHTSLTNGELMSIATWTVSNSPEFVQFSLPSPECKAQGGNWGDGHGWVWHYDMKLATQILHKFIYEEEMPAGVVVAPSKTVRPTASTTQPSVTVTQGTSMVTQSPTQTRPTATTKPTDATTSPSTTTTSVTELPTTTTDSVATTTSTDVADSTSTTNGGTTATIVTTLPTGDGSTMTPDTTTSVQTATTTLVNATTALTAPSSAE